MAHFAIIAPPLKGHYGPYSNLADELIERGHRATFVHQQDARALIEAPDGGFAAVGNDRATLESWTRPMGKIRGVIGLSGTMKRMEDFTTMLCAEGPALVRSLGVDAIIADQLEPAGGLIAEHLGIPWISIASTVPMNRDERIPPPFVNWPYDPSEKGRRRNRLGWRISDLVLRSFNRCIERNARALGLPPRRTMEDCFSRTLQIAQSVQGLDFPRPAGVTSLTYAGAFARGSAAPFALPPSDGRPTAYCTLGTLQGGRLGLFTKIAKACERAGVRLVLTHGGRGNAEAMARLPGNPLVFDWLPQRSVMEQVDMIICHGGMITVLDAFLAGRPLLIMPLAFEQPGIGARVVETGAGLMLRRQASAASMADAINLLVRDVSFRACSQLIGAELRKAGGVARAADLVEQSLGVGALQEVPTRRRAARDGARDDSRSESR